jgi:hypothetical protein
MAFFHAANWPINLYEAGRFQAKDSSPLHYALALGEKTDAS